MANLAERAACLNRATRVGSRGAAPASFALLTDRDRLPDPRPLLDLLPAGSLVVLRHYGAPGRAALAEALARACRARRLTFVIADDLDLAVAFGAGLHLPEMRARVAGARIRLWHRRTRRLLSVASHSRMALARAAMLGTDIALLSPVFATASHPDARPMGALRFRALAREAQVPVWALGGIDGTTISALRGSGAAGVATVSGLGSGRVARQVKTGTQSSQPG
jgi:thiamine-phosphate pyrophosphorylase